MGIIDHLGWQVADYDKMKAFYVAAFQPLGITVLRDYPGDGKNGPPVKACGLGRDGKPELWIAAGQKNAPHVHIAVLARSRDEVDAFYVAAIAAGAKDNGKPGLRPHYHNNYYGAFVIDPEGHNIEAVIHT